MTDQKDPYKELYQFFVRDRYSTVGSAIDPDLTQLNFYYFEISGASGASVPFMMSSNDISDALRGSNVPIVHAEGRGTLNDGGFYVVGVFFDNKDHVLSFAQGDETKVKSINLGGILASCANGNVGFLIFSGEDKAFVFNPGRTQEYFVSSAVPLLLDQPEFSDPEIGGDTFTEEQKVQISALLTNEINSVWITNHEFGILPTTDGRKINCVLFETIPGVDRSIIDVLADRLWRQVKEISGEVMLAEMAFPTPPFSPGDMGR